MFRGFFFFAGQCYRPFSVLNQMNKLVLTIAVCIKARTLFGSTLEVSTKQALKRFLIDVNYGFRYNVFVIFVVLDLNKTFDTVNRSYFNNFYLDYEMILL